MNNICNGALEFLFTIKNTVLKEVFEISIHDIKQIMTDSGNTKTKPKQYWCSFNISLSMSKAKKRYLSDIIQQLRGYISLYQ